MLPARGIVLSDHNIDDARAEAEGIINIMVREHQPEGRPQIVILPEHHVLLILLHRTLKMHTKKEFTKSSFRDTRSSLGNLPKFMKFEFEARCSSKVRSARSKGKSERA